MSDTSASKKRELAYSGDFSFAGWLRAIERRVDRRIYKEWCFTRIEMSNTLGISYHVLNRGLRASEFYSVLHKVAKILKEHEKYFLFGDDTCLPDVLNDWNKLSDTQRLLITAMVKNFAEQSQMPGISAGAKTDEPKARLVSVAGGNQ